MHMTGGGGTWEQDSDNLDVYFSPLHPKIFLGTKKETSCTSMHF